MDQGNALLAAAAALARQDQKAELLDTFMRTVGRLGLTHFIYAMEPAPGSPHVRITTLGDADPAGPEGDPFLTYCCNDYRPTMTGLAFLPDYAYLDDPATEVIRRAAKAGMRAGIGLATRLRGPNRPERGGFNIGGDLNRAEIERFALPYVNELRLVAMAADQSLWPLVRHKAVRPPATLPRLSPREIEVLTLMSTGISRIACADKLDIGQATVATHLKSAYTKLGANNLIEALRKLENTP